LPIKYVQAPDVKRRVDDLIARLGFIHIAPQFVHCFRSTGSKSRRVVARIHGLGRIWQDALGFFPGYVIEVIAERYDRLSEVEQEKTLIHELLHIPKGFSGGFRPHKGYVDHMTVERLYRKLHAR
jgi:predicted metallopeptidase